MKSAKALIFFTKKPDVITRFFQDLDVPVTKIQGLPMMLDTMEDVQVWNNWNVKDVPRIMSQLGTKDFVSNVPKKSKLVQMDVLVPQDKS